MNDKSKLNTIVFAAVFAIVCGVGISIAVFFAGSNKIPSASQTGTVFNEPKIKVHVKGAVQFPGLYELAIDKRVQDAIDAAGGVLETGNTNNLNLAAVLKDGQTINVPSGADTLVDKPAEANNVNNKININTADEQQLDELPGIGPSLAKRIIAYRNENGNFGAIEDLINVSGIGEKKFVQIKEYICK